LVFSSSLSKPLIDPLGTSSSRISYTPSCPFSFDVQSQASFFFPPERKPALLHRQIPPIPQQPRTLPHVPLTPPVRVLPIPFFRLITHNANNFVYTPCLNLHFAVFTRGVFLTFPRDSCFWTFPQNFATPYYFIGLLRFLVPGLRCRRWNLGSTTPVFLDSFFLPLASSIGWQTPCPHFFPSSTGICWMIDASKKHPELARVCCLFSLLHLSLSD